LPEKAITVDSLGVLKGKVVKHPIFKDGFVTEKNFDATVVAKAIPRAKTHVLFIQNGGQAPQKHVFKDGISDVPEPKGTTPTPRASDNDKGKRKATEKKKEASKPGKTRGTAEGRWAPAPPRGGGGRKPATAAQRSWRGRGREPRPGMGEHWSA